MKRKTLKQLSKIKILLLLALVLVAVFVVDKLPLRVDLTQGNQYSLSRTSKNLVKNLEEPVEIKVYFSKELPNYLLTTKQLVDDLLAEYKNYGGGKVKIEYIDPASDAAITEEVEGLGIPKLQFNVRQNDKYEVTNGYLGIAVAYGENTEILPIVEDVANFEYDLTLAIKKVLSGEDLYIGLATGYSAAGKDSLTYLSQLLSEQYLVLDVDLSTVQMVPEMIKTLIIAGPMTEFDEAALYKIDQFVMNGGSLLVLDDKVAVTNQLQPLPVSNNLDGLLENYGFKVNADLVDDVSNEMANFTQGYVQFYVQYPLWLNILPENFDGNNVMVSQLEKLVLPWASSVEYTGDTENREVSYLVKSTPKAWSQTADYNLDPQAQNLTYNAEASGQKNLTIAAFGPFESYFKDKQIPEEVDTDQEKKDSTDYARIIVMGDMDFIKDGFLQNFNINAIYIQNIIDGLTQDSDLINIRSKTVTDRSLKELATGTKNAVKYTVIFGPTILLVFYGLYRYYSRKRKRFIDEI